MMSAIEDNVLGIFRPPFVHQNMGGIRLESHEVLRPIIAPDTVDMMDRFARIEISPDHLFHNKPVLENIAAIIRVRMAGTMDADISRFKIAAAFPMARAVPLGIKIVHFFSEFLLLILGNRMPAPFNGSGPHLQPSFERIPAIRNWD
jgi:hypothetical protein